MYTTDEQSDYVDVAITSPGDDKMIIDLHPEQKIPLGRAGKYGQLAVDTERFNDTVREHVWIYGLRQILNDAIADKTDDDDKPLSTAELVAKAQRRLDTLYSGELRVRRESAEPADPIEAEMYRMAKKALTDAAKKTPEFASAEKGTKDRALYAIVTRSKARGDDPLIEDWDAAIAKYLGNSELATKLRRAATRIVKEREAIEAVEV